MQHFQYKTPYSESSDAQQARIYRRVIRKIPRKVLPDAQQHVLMALFNLHWKHKNASGVINASVERIAKNAKCSVRTAKRAMQKFRDEGIIQTEKYGKGGRKPTVYRFNILPMLEAYDPSYVTINTDVELVNYTDVSRGDEGRENRANVAHEYIYKIHSSTFPCRQAALEPAGEDWWASLLSSQVQPPEQTYPENERSNVISFWQGRMAA